MKSLLITLAVSSLMMSATSCNNGKSTNTPNDTEEVKDEMKVEERTEEEERADALEDDAMIRDFITNMYENDLYLKSDFLEAHCSKGLLQYLKNQYEYDGEGYAVWLFRTSSQDGKPGAEDVENKVLTITKDNEGWYHYTFTDGGWHGENKLKVHVENDEVVMDELKSVYDEDAAQYN
ncbi:MAG: hypothetical protein J5616_07775 [Bacteroidaceae bacterium]|nr:hypothetical protein [Bacteroidaceae bacterium]